MSVSVALGVAVKEALYDFSNTFWSKPMTCKLAGRTESISRVTMNVTVNINSQIATRNTKVMMWCW